MLEKNKSDHTDEDLEHMKKVRAYVKRHLGQGPSGDVEDSNWRLHAHVIFRCNATQGFASTPRRPRSRRSSWRWPSGYALMGCSRTLAPPAGIRPSIPLDRLL
jgi:hypothetical protein